MNKMLWSGITTETENALKEAFAPYFNMDDEIQQLTKETIIRTIFDAMLIHNSNGDHVYYDTNVSYKNRVKWLALKTIPVVTNLKFHDDLSVTIEVPLPENKITKSFSGDNKGMTEISPINATIGNITTPNTKSNFNATNEQTENYVNFDYQERRIKMLYSDYVNLINYFHSIFVKLIVEWNRIY